MSSPSLPLQAAIVQELVNAGAISALVGDRVYDRIPAGARFPYVALGDDNVIQDDVDDCLTAFEVFTSLHVWSREVGQPEMKRIAEAIFDVLHNAALSIAGFRLVEFEHQTTRFLRDPDGITHHAVVEFRALIDLEAST